MRTVMKIMSQCYKIITAVMRFTLLVKGGSYYWLHFLINTTYHGFLLVLGWNMSQTCSWKAHTHKHSHTHTHQSVSEWAVTPSESRMAQRSETHTHTQMQTLTHSKTPQSVCFIHHQQTPKYHTHSQDAFRCQRNLLNSYYKLKQIDQCIKNVTVLDSVVKLTNDCLNVNLI